MQITETIRAELAEKAVAALAGKGNLSGVRYTGANVSRQGVTVIRLNFEVTGILMPMEQHALRGNLTGEVTIPLAKELGLRLQTGTIVTVRQ